MRLELNTGYEETGVFMYPILLYVCSCDCTLFSSWRAGTQAIAFVHTPWCQCLCAYCSIACSDMTHSPVQEQCSLLSVCLFVFWCKYGLLRMSLLYICRCVWFRCECLWMHYTAPVSLKLQIVHISSILLQHPVVPTFCCTTPYIMHFKTCMIRRRYFTVLLPKSVFVISAHAAISKCNGYMKASFISAVQVLFCFRFMTCCWLMQRAWWWCRLHFCLR